MARLDTHNHFLPGLDDGCQNLAESFACLRLMVAAGYDRLFVTPHCGDVAFTDLTTDQIARYTAELRAAVARENIPIDLRPGGELRLAPDLPELAKANGLPTLGLTGAGSGASGGAVLFDLWEEDWPAWASRAVEWLLKNRYVPILAHPERMPYLRAAPEKIDELARLGLRFQGNLGPIAGHDSPQVTALAERYLKDGRYFMLATDGHRPANLPHRLSGLARAEALVGAEAVRLLTELNPATLWL